MKKWILFFFLVLLVGGCSQKEEINQLTTNYETQLDGMQKEIEAQQKQIKELQEQIDANKLIPDESYRISLQEADREARKIMRLISEGKLEELKQEYHVEFEVKENQIIFGQPEFNSPFPIDWASNFMYIGNFIKQKDGMEINYFISNPKNDRSELISISFDNDMNFNFIFVGDA